MTAQQLTDLRRRLFHLRTEKQRRHNEAMAAPKWPTFDWSSEAL